MYSLKWAKSVVKTYSKPRYHTAPLPYWTLQETHIFRFLTVKTISEKNATPSKTVEGGNWYLTGHSPDRIEYKRLSSYWRGHQNYPWTTRSRQNDHWSARKGNYYTIMGHIFDHYSTLFLFQCHISNDGATILQLLDIVHPAAKTLVDIAKSQDAEIGDGTTSVTLLACEFMTAMKRYVEDGVHPQLIIRALRTSSQLAVKRIKVSSALFFILMLKLGTRRSNRW